MTDKDFVRTLVGKVMTPYDADAIIKSIERLKSENGSLRERMEKTIIPPYRIGDKLYHLSGTQIIEYQVSMITFLLNGKFKIRLSYQLPCYKSKSVHEIYAEEMRKDYFETYEDA